MYSRDRPNKLLVMRNCAASLITGIMMTKNGITSEKIK